MIAARIEAMQAAPEAGSGHVRLIAGGGVAGAGLIAFLVKACSTNPHPIIHP